MRSETCEMLFCIVIYSTLGLSAFWEIHEEIIKISDPRSGLGLHFTWVLKSFWEQLGVQNRKKAIQKP